MPFVVILSAVAGLQVLQLPENLSGEQLIFSNNDLLKSRLRNYQRMQERRVVLPFGVTYQTLYLKDEHSSSASVD